MLFAQLVLCCSNSSADLTATEMMAYTVQRGMMRAKPAVKAGIDYSWFRLPGFDWNTYLPILKKRNPNVIMVAAESQMEQGM